MEATSEEDLKRQRELELSSLQEELAALTSQYETMELNIKKYDAGKQVYTICM